MGRGRREGGGEENGPAMGPQEQDRKDKKREMVFRRRRGRKDSSGEGRMEGSRQGPKEENKWKRKRVE